MPLTLAKVRGATECAHFQYLGETVNLVVRTSAMSPAFFADLAAFNMLASGGDAEAAGAALMADPAALHRVGALLCRVVAEWDLLGEDGETPYPLAPAALSELPFDFLTAALMAATEAMALPEANGARPAKISPLPSSRKGSME